ncbi:MAG: BrnT family toxin [Gemmatimonadota bacterium]
MTFDFDPAKSDANKTKHGIDFNEAVSLWEDPNRIEIAARTADEPRFMAIGKIADKLWSAVVTYRGESIRVISVRRSRSEEVKLYENQSA